MPQARSLALGERGTLFVGTHAGKVYAVPPGGGRAVAMARDLQAPHGVAFRDGALYVGEIARILRYDDIEAQLAGAARSPWSSSRTCRRERHHGWKFIRFGPDGKLYVGSARRATSASRTRRYGIISAHERRRRRARDLRARRAQQRRLRLGSAHEGAVVHRQRPRHAGRRRAARRARPRAAGRHALRLPVLPRRRRRRSRSSAASHACSEFTPPAQKLGAHVASLGMRFYTGHDVSRSEYRGAIFIAEHGSWNRTPKIGYRVTRGEARGRHGGRRYEPFAEGWLQGDDGLGPAGPTCSSCRTARCSSPTTRPARSTASTTRTARRRAGRRAPRRRRFSALRSAYAPHRALRRCLMCRPCSRGASPRPRRAVAPTVSALPLMRCAARRSALPSAAASAASSEAMSSRAAASSCARTSAMPSATADQRLKARAIDRIVGAAWPSHGRRALQPRLAPQPARELLRSVVSSAGLVR